MFKAAAYGGYALIMSCVAIGAVPATVGFDRLLVREVAAFHASGDWARLKGILRRAFQIALVASAVVAAVVYFGALRWLRPLDPEAVQALRIAAILIPVVAFARLRQATLQGLGQMVPGQLPEAVIQPTVMILLVGVSACWLTFPRTSGLALTLQLLAAGSALVLGIVLLKRHLPAQLAKVDATYRTREWLSAGTTFMALIGMSAILTNIDTILVGTLIGPAEAGIYRVASQLAMFVGLPLTAVSISMAPSISALHSTGRRDELRLRATDAARAALTGAIAIAAAIGLMGPWVLGAFGPEFQQAYVPAMILVGAYVIHAFMATASYLLFMTAHERAAMLAFAASMVVNISGNLLFIPAFGIEGAAIATGLSLCFVSGTCALLAWRLIGIDATALSLFRQRKGL